jgi:Cdc6-like AAA superfamily ATPase
MEQINQIQERLFSIDSTSFECLCGQFLYYHSEFPVPPVTSGKAVAKTRPRKGNPDGYYFDGIKYHFIVCSAMDGRQNKKKLVKKITDDITNALSQSKTQIEPEQVAAIHVCIADDIQASTDMEIRNSFSEYSTLIKIWNGYQIASLIYAHYSNLIEPYLGITINRKNIHGLREYLDKTGSLPESLLINTYVRPEGFDIAFEKFKNGNVLIISGSSGTGKTRLAIELMKEFTSASKSRRGYCIRSNAAPIQESLDTTLSPGENVLLIDDAGRETSNLLRVIQQKQANHKYIDKLILTTRDYSLNAIKEVLSDSSINYELYELNPCSVDFLERVITKQGLTNQQSINRISSIAKGRIRIAIMGVEAIKNGIPEEDLNAEKIYNSFFQSIVKDRPELNNDLTQKILAIIYFFKYIDFESPASIKGTVGRFGLDEVESKKAAWQLKEGEFLDEMENIYRVGDQEIGFYHFFKVFIKDNTLPLRNLLGADELKYTHQLKETIGQCFKIFEKSTMLIRVKDLLEEIYINLGSDDLRYEFLDAFGSEFQDFSFELTRQTVYSLKEQENKPAYLVKDFTTHTFSWNRLRVVRYLKQVLTDENFSISTYLELYMELVRRLPDLFNDYLHFIYSEFKWKDGDKGTNYPRQRTLFSILKKHNSNNDTLATMTICALAQHWLHSVYPDVCYYVKKGNKASLQPDAKHIPVRDIVWQLLILQIGGNLDSYRFLRDYVNQFDRGDKTYFAVDSKYIHELIFKYLKPHILQHGILVNDLTKEIHALTSSFSWIEESKKLFFTPDVLMADALSRRTIRRYGKKNIESEEKYLTRILEDVIPHFNEPQISDSFIRMYEVGRVIVTEQKDVYYNGFVYNRLRSLLESMAKNYPSDFILSLNYLVSCDNTIGLIVQDLTFKSIFETAPDDAIDLHTLLSGASYKSKDAILLNYYYALPERYLKQEHGNGLRNLFENRVSLFYLNPNCLLKFKRFIPDLFVFIAETSVKRYNEAKIQISIDHSQKELFFDTIIKFNYGLAEKFYVLQIDGIFIIDDNGKILSKLVQRRPDFLIELVDGILDRHIKAERGWNIGVFLFDRSYTNADDIFSKLLALYISKQFPSEEFIELVFGSLHPETVEYENSLEMFLRYISSQEFSFVQSRKLIRIAVKQFTKNWLDIFNAMISNNFNPKWIHQCDFSVSSVYSGHDIISDIRKSQLEKILDMITHTDLIIQNPIRFQYFASELQKLIRGSLKSAREERREKFKGHIW